VSYALDGEAIDVLRQAGVQPASTADGALGAEKSRATAADGGVVSCW
jgi:hypothetical protein